MNEHAQPPPEVTTLDPWPADAPPAPAAITRLQKAAHASWEVRLGYSRGYRKVGRGNVGTSVDARWELTHAVCLRARPAGARGRSWVTVLYSAPALAGRLTWGHTLSVVPGKFRAGVNEAKAVLGQDSAVAVAMTETARKLETVAPVTDVFAL